MVLRERFGNVIKGGLAFVEAMEAGSSGYVQDRIERLERRVLKMEETLRLSAVPPSAENPAPTPALPEPP